MEAKKNIFSPHVLINLPQGGHVHGTIIKSGLLGYCFSYRFISSNSNILVPMYFII